MICVVVQNHGLHRASSAGATSVGSSYKNGDSRSSLVLVNVRPRSILRSIVFLGTFLGSRQAARDPEAEEPIPRIGGDFRAMGGTGCRALPMIVAAPQRPLDRVAEWVHVF